MKHAHHIAIRELVLRLPGVEPADVPTLVDDVLERVQDRLRGTGRSGEVQLAELHVTLRASTSRDAVIEAVADALVEALR